MVSVEQIADQVQAGRNVSSSANKVFVDGEQFAVVHRSQLRDKGFTSLDAFVERGRTIAAEREARARQDKEEQARLAAKLEAEKLELEARSQEAGARETVTRETAPSGRIQRPLAISPTLSRTGLTGGISSIVSIKPIQAPVKEAPSKAPIATGIIPGSAAERIGMYRALTPPGKAFPIGTVSGQPKDYITGIRPIGIVTREPGKHLRTKGGLAIPDFTKTQQQQLIQVRERQERIKDKFATQFVTELGIEAVEGAKSVGRGILQTHPLNPFAASIAIKKLAPKTFKDFKPVGFKPQARDVGALGFVTATAGASLIGGTVAKVSYAGLTALSGYTGYQFVKSPSPKGLAQFTLIAVPTAVGGFGMARGVYVKGRSLIKGYKAVPAETVFDPGVLRGEGRFPTVTSVKQAQAQFKAADYKLIHATGKPFKAGAIEIAKGESAEAGLYFSAYGRGSPHFLRTELGTPSGYELSFLPKTTKPTALITVVKGVKRLPKGIREAPFETRRAFLKTQAGKEKAFITQKLERGVVRGRKAEIEAVLPETTPGKLERFKGYTKVGGKVVEFQEFVPLKKGSKLTKDVITLKEARVRTSKYSKYVSVRKIPIRSPRISSYAPTSKSLMASTTSFIKPSRATPVSRIKPSIVSPISRVKPSKAIAPSKIIPSGIITPSKITPVSRIKPSIVSPISRVKPSKVSYIRTIKTPFVPTPKTRTKPFKSFGLRTTRVMPRRRTRLFKFTPSLVAIEKGIKKKRPKILTGLEIRPLL